MDKSVEYSGHTWLFVGGKELGRVPCLAICDEKRQIGMFHCDRDWNVLGSSGYQSVAETKENAERIYPGISARWIDAKVTEEEAEHYLDELFGDLRCTFCGRRGDQLESLIDTGKVKLCNYCIADGVAEREHIEIPDELYRPAAKRRDHVSPRRKARAGESMRK